MSERWFGRITERAMMDNVKRMRRTTRVEKVVEDESAKQKDQTSPIELTAPKPAFLEPLC